MLSIMVALGESDCENVGRGLLAQPVNAISSLAFTVAGVALLAYVDRASGFERHLRIAFAFAMMATGIGSFLYHGPQTAGSQYLHDMTFLLALAVIVAANGSAALGWSARSVWIGLASVFGLLTVALLALPAITNAFSLLAVVAISAAHVAVRRRGRPGSAWTRVAAGAMALALLFFLLGRTDGILCDSESLLQGHALWHVFSAVALAAYFIATGYSREAA